MDYIELLKQRSKESKVYVEYQMTGLMLADILEDQPHKSLYMRLAKKHDKDMLMKIAKDVADRNNVANKGAYFMKMLSKEASVLKSKEKVKTSTLPF